MKVHRLIARLEELDQDAIAVVMVAGHSLDIEGVEESVTTPSNPHGWVDITLSMNCICQIRELLSLALCAVAISG